MIGISESENLYNIHDVGEIRSCGVRHVMTTWPFYQSIQFSRVNLHCGLLGFLPKRGLPEAKVLTDFHYSSLLS